LINVLTDSAKKWGLTPVFRKMCSDPEFCDPEFCDGSVQQRIILGGSAVLAIAHVIANSDNTDSQ
jgi:hypothetical protein